MTTVQRTPGGLLELLSAKTSGYTLDDLAKGIQPTLDMTAMMGLGLPLETVKVVGAAVAEGSAITITVPATQWWMLYAASTQFTSTTTGTFLNSIRISADADSTNTVALARELTGLAIAATFVAGAIFVPHTPWLLPPGTVLWCVMDLLGVDATAAISMNCRIARLA